jgi:hypothetical protein
LAAQLVVTHRQMQRYERDLKRIGAARLHARAQTVGVAVRCLYVGLDEATAKRPIGPHERLVLSTVGSVGAEHSLGQGVQRGRHLEVRGRVPRALQRRGHPPECPAMACCRIGERSSHTWFVLKYLLGYRT